MPTYTHPEVLRLAAAADCDPRTVEKWGRGEKVLSAIDKLLRAEALALGLAVPPGPRGLRAAHEARIATLRECADDLDEMLTQPRPSAAALVADLLGEVRAYRELAAAYPRALESTAARNDLRNDLLAIASRIIDALERHARGER